MNAVNQPSSLSSSSSLASNTSHCIVLHQCNYYCRYENAVVKSVESINQLKMASCNRNADSKTDFGFTYLQLLGIVVAIIITIIDGNIFLVLNANAKLKQSLSAKIIEMHKDINNHPFILHEFSHNAIKLKQKNVRKTTSFMYPEWNKTNLNYDFNISLNPSKNTK